jgi:hypothetical protein
MSIKIFKKIISNQLTTQIVINVAPRKNRAREKRNRSLRALLKSLNPLI